MMAAILLSRTLRPSLFSTRLDVILSLPTPSLQCARIASTAHFSTSPVRCKKDNNSTRGQSAIRGTGLRPRQTLSVTKRRDLPKPVKIKRDITGTEDHGLWDFFKGKKLLQTPVEEHRHGREWTVGELRNRSWDDLHQLWWLCVKERNRLATEKIERERLDTGYGDYENKNRDETVQKTMKAILDTLAERHQAYYEALEIAKNDPTIDLSIRGRPQWQGPPPEDTYDAEDDTDTASDEEPQSRA